MAAQWWWFEDQLSDDCRDWSLVSYDDAAAQKLEQAFQQGAADVRVGRWYTVNLKEMAQYNNKTGNARAVLREGLDAQWEWQDDDGVSWVPYSEAVSLRLERAHQNQDPLIHLGGTQGWEVDFTSMEQTNTAFSGRKRSIRRVDLAGGAGGGGGGGGGGGAAAAPLGPPPVGLGRPAAAAAAAAPVGRWEWLDDKGRWRSYDAHLSAMLEAEFTASKPGADLPGRHGWHVDFTTMPMQQQNTATTGAMRNVQRVTDAGTAAAAGAAVAATFDALKGSLGKMLGGAGGGGGGAPGGGAGAAADGGGGGGGGGAMMFAGGAPGVDPAAAPAAAAEAPAGAGAAAAADDLPYGGDIQAAMRANDRDAIRQIMAARSAAADGGGAAAADGDGDGGAGGGGDAMDMDGGGGGGGGAGGVEAPSPAAAPAIGAAGGMAPPIPWAEIASSIPAGEFDGCFEPTDVPFSAEELREDCAVCYCPVYDPAAGVAAAEDVPTKLNKCGHCFHRGCINDSLAKCAPKCPVCSTIYGTITGNQPEGAMDIKRNRSKLPGYESARGTIVIDYCIPGGTQGPEHPNPGVAYHGANRTCYIPDSDAGNALLAKLQTAWDRKLIFTVGTSTTSGRENMTIWAGIHHKTRTDGGAERHGFPDPTFMERCTEELAAKGVF